MVDITIVNESYNGLYLSQLRTEGTHPVPFFFDLGARNKAAQASAGALLASCVLASCFHISIIIIINVWYIDTR